MSVITKVPKDAAGLPLCPYCKKPTRRSPGASTVTLMYFPPIYDKNGVNTNPDRNWRSSTWSCLECNRNYGYRTNGEDEEIRIYDEAPTDEQVAQTVSHIKNHPPFVGDDNSGLLETGGGNDN
jgi:hypothetical protein